MRHQLDLILRGAVAGLMFLIVCAAGPATAVENVVIGASLPLSGENAGEGRAMRGGLELFMEATNSSGGIDGRPLKIIFKDDQNNPDAARAVAQGFGKRPEVVAVIGHQFSGVALAASEVYAEYQLPHISPSASNPNVTRSSPWSFSMNYHDDLQGENMAVYLKEVLDARSILVVHTDDAYGTGLLESFSKKARRLGLGVVQAITYNEEEKFGADFIESKLGEDSGAVADAAVLFAHTAEGGALVRQLRAQGFDKSVIGPDSFAKKSFITGLANDTEDVFVSSPFLYELSSLMTKRFAEGYREKYLEKYEVEPTVWGAFCYDAAQMVAAAVAAGGGDRTGVRDGLMAYDSPGAAFSGITGKLHFDEDGAMTRPIVVSYIDDGQFKPAFTQLRRVTEQHVLNNLRSRINEGEVVKADGIPYYLTQVVYTGLDFYRINSVDVAGQNFDVEFFIWYRWKGEIDVENIDFLNGIYGIEDKIEVLREDRTGPINYLCYKIKGTYLTPYDVRLFPFDTQHLPITVSHKSKDANQIMLVLDAKNLSDARLDEIYPEEWDYVGREDYSGTHALSSTFGDPSYTGGDSEVEFSIYQTNIIIRRILFPYLVTLFLPFFIMVVVSLLMFLIPTSQFDARISLVMTALLSILVFHLSQEEAWPNVGYLVAADKYFMTAYILTFALILESIVANWLVIRERTSAAAKLDFGMAVTVVPVTIAIFAYITYGSVF
jgi:ABC-type branched-subunit amino acid transport system substrate-binding protein